MTRDELISYRQAWKRREESRGRVLKELEERALAEVEGLAGTLKNSHGCRSVYLIGSLARGEFEEDSDIDLVVEGLDPVFPGVGGDYDDKRISRGPDPFRECHWTDAG